jgi:outer membrane murein-binding lipoprotein Lpp
MGSIIAAAVTGVLTLIGVLVCNSRSRAVMEVKIDQLSSRVEKHNQMIERTYALDARCKVIEPELSGLASRLRRESEA